MDKETEAGERAGEKMWPYGQGEAHSRSSHFPAAAAMGPGRPSFQPPLPSALAFPALLCHLFNVCIRSNRSPGIADGSMRNVTAMRGDTVEFRCRLDNAGKHTVAFFRDGHPPRLIAYDESVFRRVDKYELLPRLGGDQWVLRVRDVQEDDGGGYICQLNSTPVLAKVGFLELKIPPSISRSSTPAAVEVREGHNVTLSCHARGNPPPTIVWRRADRQIIRYNGADGYGADSVHKGPELALSRVSRHHMSEYVCLAANGIPPDESWTIKLHVLFEPVVVPQSLLVEAPVDALLARLVCTVEAWPRPNVVWLFQGQPLRDSAKYATEQSVSERYKSVHVLEIRQLQSGEFGPYRCVASNDYGSHFGEIRLIEAPPLDGDLLRNSLNEGSGLNPDQEDEGEGGEEEEEEDESRRRPWLWPVPYARRTSTSPSVWLRNQLSPDKELRRSVARGASSSNHHHFGVSAASALGCPLTSRHCFVVGLCLMLLPLLLPLLMMPSSSLLASF